MKTIELMALIFVGTYYVASFIQTLFHRVFGHTRRILRVYRVHVNGHHAQYSRSMITPRWIPTEQHVAWYYAVPFVPMVLTMYCLLPGDLFLAHIGGLVFAIGWHVYLHRQYHVRGVWWERFAWFQRKRRLHILHHRRPHKNYAIVEYFWDRLLGTFHDSRRRVDQTPAVPPLRRISERT